MVVELLKAKGYTYEYYSGLARGPQVEKQGVPKRQNYVVIL
jgi:hypothetical protein